MTRIRHYFGEIDITWPRLAIFTLLTSAFTVAMNVIPIFYDTSFQDIAVVLDAWFLFAMFIIMNSKTMKEAVIKTFLFFLVGQPLIYLMEVPFLSMGWEVFGYYGYWFKMTLLTIPGSAIAFLVKKKNWLSVLVLSVATSYLAYSSVHFLATVLSNFPHHLLSSIFAFALGIFFIFCFIEDGKKRLAALIIMLVAFGGSLYYHQIGFGGATTEIELGEGVWTMEIEDQNIVSGAMEDENTAKLKLEGKGSTLVSFHDENGNVREFYATVSGYDIWIDELEPEE